MPPPSNCIAYPRKEQSSKCHNYFASPPSESLLQGKAGFLIYDDHFLAIVGNNPTIRVIAEDATEPFAHEVGVYIPATGSVFITSNHIIQNGQKTVQISKVSKTDCIIHKDDDGNAEHIYSIETIEPESNIILANGGVNYKSRILFCEQGSLTTPSGLVYMCPSTYKTTPLLTHYHTPWFNSPNDVIIHNDGSIWFTDPPYGHEQGIRPVPQLPAHTYRFDPESGDIRAVEDSLRKPNGPVSRLIRRHFILLILRACVAIRDVRVCIRLQDLRLFTRLMSWCGRGAYF